MSPSSVSAPSSPQPATEGSAGETILELEGLYHKWKGPKPPVLDDVGLSLRAGEVTWIGGRNGAGKTTLLRLAAGILLPQRGSVRLGELTPSSKGGLYRRQIGFLSAGDRSLQARMRVSQQLDYWAQLAYVPRGRRAELVASSLQRFGLDELAERRVDRISQGQRQRIRLAMAFLHEPRVILLDEPRNSLDDDGYQLLGQQIERAAGEGGAIFSQGYLTVSDSNFQSDLARGGAGGTAGLGGEGGEGGRGGESGDLRGGTDNVAIEGGKGGAAGNGGSSGDSGDGGDALGGAVFYETGATGSLPDALTVFSSDLSTAGSICDNLGTTQQSCDTTAGPAGQRGGGGESTPCKNEPAEKECPVAPEGIPGAPGAAGTIGAKGHAEGEDVAGAPGSGEPPAKKTGGGSGGGGGGSSGGGSSGSGSSSTGGSGSSSTNTGASTPHTGTPSATGSSVSVTVSCTGGPGQSCTIIAAITVEETLKGRKVTAVTSRKDKRPKVRHITVTLGTVTATVPAGSTRKLTVNLSAAGLRLLSSKHSLPVRFTVTSSLAGAASAKTTSSILVQTNLTLHAGHAKHKR
jgi:ABC-type Na+ transport system ATPase subunit NatA